MAELKRQGHAAHAVFVGSFIGNATVDVEATFRAQVRDLSLQNDVTVTGYIGPAGDVFAALEACDVLVYRFEEGLTARRSSVLAALQSGRPVLVNRPQDEVEFAHHPTFQTALADGALHLVSQGSDTAEYVEKVLSLAASRQRPPSVNFNRAWGDAIAAILRSAPPARQATPQTAPVVS